MSARPSDGWSGAPAHSAIVVPFRGRNTDLLECLRSALGALPEGSRIVVVDDGAERPLDSAPELQPLIADRRIVLLRHPATRGPGAARNTGIAWCRAHGVDTAILLDADCVAPRDLVESHLRLHRADPGALCVGGAIEGRGEGVWARLDAMMSWFTSTPSHRPGTVQGIVHIPTTNMSLKLTAQLPERPFDERLRTGEDVAFVAAMRRRGERLLFSPRPVVVHKDRAGFRDFFRHQYRWGLHSYVVRFGRPDDSVLRRLVFAVAFLAASPAYACLATWLNMRPWLHYRPADWPWTPIVWAGYLVKAVAVAEGALRPDRALFPAPQA